MRAFVLCTGRCGSVTLARACSHIRNYTSGHETRAHLMGGRLDYPDNHIEADNRLAWHLGELDQRFGTDPVYVHLYRDPERVAESYAKRFHIKAGIVGAYSRGIVRGKLPQTPSARLAAARRLVETTTANIHQFMADKPSTVVIDIDDPRPGFLRLCGLLWAEVDMDTALAEFERRYNAS